ncbi:HNH endonuclease [Pseudomonadota bacterium]
MCHYAAARQRGPELDKKIDWQDRPQKYCTKCDRITHWNSHDRCLVCQRKRSRAYAERKKASGGNFSQGVKRTLMKAHPERCPSCLIPWNEIPKHSQHPNTPWHFDHIVSPQLGGTNDPGNAQILCWPCNLRKLNKLENAK